GMTCWRRLRDWQDEGWIHYDSSVPPTRPGRNASNVGGWRQQYQATATVNGTSATPNSPINQAVGPVSAVIRLKNAWMMPLCVACMIVDGQTLPERIRSQACTTAEAMTRSVKTRG